MRKSRLILLSALVVSTIIASTVVVNLIRGAPSPTPPTLFNYTAKWICNTPFRLTTFNGTLVNAGSAERIGLVPGEYKTDVNVHNPGPSNVTIVKKFVLSASESPFMPRPNVTAVIKTFSGPDVAFFITCDEIQSLLHLPAGQAFKGFVILQTTVSNLDVVAEYTSEAFDFTPECPFSSPFAPLIANANCVESSTLDVEMIAAVATSTPLPTPCSPSSSISVSPSSLTIPKNSSGSATISIIASPCSPITECFSVMFMPSANGGITGSFAPPCVNISAGGSAVATLTIFVPAGAVSGPYTVTITATCTTCSPTFNQVATITLTVP